MNTQTIIPQTGIEARQLIREGRFIHPTSGVAPHHVQANVAILPEDAAFEFLLFCQRNPKPCPVVEVLEAGQVEAALTAPGSDIRTDVARYRVFKNGVLVNEPENLESYWRNDLVTFLLGCSFSFEHALMANGIDLPYYATERNVPMFITDIETTESGRFSGPMVVSQRWIRADKVVRAVQATSRFPDTHGAPIHIGDPAAIGIADITKPDYGEVWEQGSADEVPMFWACGVTPQSVAMSSKPELMITHSPGYMFVTDVMDEELAVI